ncbi:hypothetical protein EJ06DRAFT_581542 [Trichodelitschia bisporula]|uniref:26S proteasome complex subunit SEM1 n=1 Tax=Trichodelitschia bisporula TaxID=703511 RepID=A0A6G1HZE6_9PEZI|nr:hypothetical protein EJ06DRAFT_581542 [Trichodelitschia bisporula]
MSAPASTSTDKAAASDSKSKPANPPAAAALGEDDEFEDFPVEDWAEEDTGLPSGKQHLWEESWDDDDTTDDFSKQLKEELKKIDSSK